MTIPPSWDVQTLTVLLISLILQNKTKFIRHVDKHFFQKPHEHNLPVPGYVEMLKVTGGKCDRKSVRTC